MSSFFRVSASGTPYERGFETGRQGRARILRLIEAQFKYYQEIYKETPEKVLAEARKFLTFIQEFSPSSIEEITGIANGVECDIDEILMINCVFELMADRNPFVQESAGYVPNLACTSFAAAGNATRDGSIYVGQNIDGRYAPWQEVYNEFDYVLHAETENGLRYITYTHSGALALSGMNSLGLGLTMNNLHCGEYGPGVPYVVLAREMLLQKSLYDVVKVLERVKRTGSFNFLLGDTQGRLLDIEMLPEDYDLLWSQDIHVHTNHFISESLRKIIAFDVGCFPGSNSHFRRERVLALMRDQLGEIDAEFMKDVCRDHEGFPSSVCAHNNPSLPIEHQGRTFSSMVFDLIRNKAWLSKGWPCEGKFVPYEI